MNPDSPWFRFVVGLVGIAIAIHHFRYEQLGLSGTTVIGTLSQAQLAHALASLLMAETGMVERRAWRRR
jgi:uncharacterized membrane protein YdcZ (DUF606 family)